MSKLVAKQYLIGALTGGVSPRTPSFNVPVTGTFSVSYHFPNYVTTFFTDGGEAPGMALSDIAEGIATTRTQEDRGVAVVDRTDQSIASVLAQYSGALPCDPDVAATLVTEYTAGASVGDAAAAAGIPPVTASKALHRLGFEGLSPLSPLGREIVDDWLEGSISRSDALALADTTEREFALAVYLQTHDPIPGAAEAVQDSQSTDADAMVEKRDALSDTMTASQDLC